MITDTTIANFYCLVGNKSDLEEKRQVTQQDAIKFATKYSLQYIETSALEGINIERVFDHVTTSLYTEMQKKKISLTLGNENSLGHSKIIGFSLPEDGKGNKGTSSGSGCFC